MKLLIRRIKNYKHSDKQTIGNAYYFIENNGVGYTCRTLELPWKDNEKRISCIPDGEYEVIKHTSPKFGECFWIQDVPDRSEILFHSGSFYTNTLGCVLVGKGFTDINGDGLLDLVHSRDTMKDLLKLLPNKFKLIIEWS
jgi:hypothetical protein